MPEIVVLFEVKPTKEGKQRYLDLAAMLKPMLAGFEGFIRAERFTSLNEEGKLLSMNVWTDEEAVDEDQYSFYDVPEDGEDMYSLPDE